METSLQIELSAEERALVMTAVESGAYETPEEVVHAALHTWSAKPVDKFTEMEMDRICDEALADMRPGLQVDVFRHRMAAYCEQLETGKHVDDAT